MSSPTLEVEDLNVTLPTPQGPLHAARHVNLAIGSGETLCIVGESGSGKSMTALALMDLLPPGGRRKAARLRLENEDLTAASESRMQALRGDRMAMIFQDPTTALNPAFTIGEQIIEGLLCHRPDIRREQAMARAIALIETCGISQARLRLRQYPHELSGGLRQRVMIAMALMSEPALIIADEPTTALDVTIAAQILALLARLQREFSLAMLLITHDLGIVGRVSQRVAIMYAGEIVETGPTEAVLRQPMHPYTQALLASDPARADPKASPSGRLSYLPGQVPTLIGDLTGCQFRNRCRLAVEACAGAIPLQKIGERSYRCLIAPSDMDGRARAGDAVTADTSAAAPASAAGVTPAFELAGITVTYRVGGGLFGKRRNLQALRGVTLSIAAGEALGIVGESGSGKSTLARIMLNLEVPESGTVRLNGHDITSYDRRDLARAVQPVFQDPYSSLNPRRTIAATIRRPLEVLGLGDRSARDQEVLRIMNLCGLPARLADAYPAELSGGQRQRVAIASALIARPAIMVCDEPTSALDVSIQSQILNLLRDLRAELGLTLVLISHDLSVIRYLADRIAVIYLGKIIEIGAADSLFEAPRHPYTRMLLEATTKVAGSEKFGEFPSAIDPPSGCGFHTRCPLAMPMCSREPPPWRHSGTQQWSCHLEGSETPAVRSVSEEESS